MEYETALQKVINAAAFAKPGALIQYAASYASAGKGMTGYERHVQCLYILNNLSQWRGEEAKAVKEALKKF